MNLDPTLKARLKDFTPQSNPRLATRPSSGVQGWVPFFEIHYRDWCFRTFANRRLYKTEADARLVAMRAAFKRIRDVHNPMTF